MVPVSIFGMIRPGVPAAVGTIAPAGGTFVFTLVVGGTIPVILLVTVPDVVAVEVTVAVGALPLLWAATAIEPPGSA